MGLAFLGLCVLAGAALIAWAVYYVGRQIARVLWGILVVVEKDDQQRRILEKQERQLFG